MTLDLPYHVVVDYDYEGHSFSALGYATLDEALQAKERKRQHVDGEYDIFVVRLETLPVPGLYIPYFERKS